MPTTRKHSKDILENEFLCDIQKDVSLPWKTKHTGIDKVTTEDSDKEQGPAKTISMLENRIRQLEIELMMTKGDTQMAKNNGKSGPMEKIGVSEKNEKLTSGYEIKNQANVINRILWPHGFLSKLQQVTCTDADRLDPEAFLFGYMEILLQMKGTAEFKGRLIHLKQVMWHSILHGWDSARNFHYQVLQELELGNINWQDQSDMALLSLSAVHEKSNKHTSDQKVDISPQVGNEDSSIYCFFYNTDENGCRFVKSESGCKKLHACSSCGSRGFLNSHPAFECWKC